MGNGQGKAWLVDAPEASPFLARKLRAFWPMSRKICPNRSRGGLLKHIGNFAVEACASVVSVSRRMHPVLRLTALCVISIAPLARAMPPPAEVLAVNRHRAQILARYTYPGDRPVEPGASSGDPWASHDGDQIIGPDRWGTGEPSTSGADASAHARATAD